MQMGQAAILDQAQAVLGHLVGLGREAGDQVGAEHGIRPASADLGAKGHGIGPAVAPLHALQDHVVPRLQAQMEMRHQALFLAEQGHQVRVDLHRVKGGQAQARQLPRHIFLKKHWPQIPSRRPGMVARISSSMG